MRSRRSCSSRSSWPRCSRRWRCSSPTTSSWPAWRCPPARAAAARPSCSASAPSPTRRPSRCSSRPTTSRRARPCGWPSSAAVAASPCSRWWPAATSTPAELESLRALSELVTAALVNASLYASQQEALRRLRELDGLKTVFLGTASHELRTPATAIAGFAGLLTSSWDRFTEEQRRDFVGRIAANARSLSTVVQDLLDFSLLDRGTLSRVARAARRRRGGRRRRRPARRRRSPSTRCEADIEADAAGRGRPQRPRARHHQPAHQRGEVLAAGHHDPRRRPRRRRATCWSRCATKGPGVPAEERERVFTRFYRGSGDAVLQTRGVGIGLSVVSEFVARMHGEVTRRRRPWRRRPLHRAPPGRHHRHRRGGRGCDDVLNSCCPCSCSLGFLAAAVRAQPAADERRAAGRRRPRGVRRTPRCRRSSRSQNQRFVTSFAGTAGARQLRRRSLRARRGQRGRPGQARGAARRWSSAHRLPHRLLRARRWTATITQGVQLLDPSTHRRSPSSGPATTSSSRSPTFAQGIGGDPARCPSGLTTNEPVIATVIPILDLATGAAARRLRVRERRGRRQRLQQGDRPAAARRDRRVPRSTTSAARWSPRTTRRCSASRSSDERLVTGPLGRPPLRRPARRDRRGARPPAGGWRSGRTSTSSRSRWSAPLESAGRIAGRSASWRPGSCSRSSCTGGCGPPGPSRSGCASSARRSRSSSRSCRTSCARRWPASSASSRPRSTTGTGWTTTSAAAR